MITIDNVQYRNIEEQVKKNMDDIQYILEEGVIQSDLTLYQLKTDETLETESKEIVGAINEVNTKLTESESSFNSKLDKKLDKKTANDDIFECAYIFYKRNNVDYQGFKYICPGDNKLLGAIAKYDENANLGSGEPVKNSDCATKGYVDYTIDSDLSSTTATINDAVKQTRYVRGTLTELSFTFKMNDDIETYTLKDGDEIIIEFISGSTATTVTRDTTNAIYNFSTVGANKFVEINAEYKASIGK